MVTPKSDGQVIFMSKMWQFYSPTELFIVRQLDSQTVL